MTNCVGNVKVTLTEGEIGSGITTYLMFSMTCPEFKETLNEQSKDHNMGKAGKAPTRYWGL